MPTPRLLHPVPVYLRQIDRTFTAKQDTDIREPIGQARRRKKPTRLVAQIADGETDTVVASEGGTLKRSDGYLLFRTADLRGARVTLQEGDRIVQIGDQPNDREVDLYLTRFKFIGHYPRARGATLVKAFYNDRHPSRQRGDR